MTPNKIQDDLVYLFDCFREVLKECDEAELCPLIPFGNTNGNYLLLENTPPKTFELLSLCFQLLNMVEENAATQYRRSIEDKSGLSLLPGLWGQTLKKCLGYGLSFSEIAESLPNMSCESVLTAHPTEAKRASVLAMHRELYLLIVKRENGMWTKYERNQIREEIKQILERLWKTGEIYLQKPDISSERKNIEYYLNNVFPEAVALVDLRFKQAWLELGGEPELIKSPENLPKLSFGNWVGGDRDGHPLVTPEITKQTLESFTDLALAIHKDKIMNLVHFLSLSDRLQTPPKSLLKQIDLWKEKFPEVGSEILAKNMGEPWRQFCNFLLLELDSKISIAEYLLHLRNLKESLEATKAYRLAEQLIFPIERMALSFGFHLAKTDIRQNSAYHAIVIEQILKASGEKDYEYRSWSEATRLEFLKRELVSPRPFLLPQTPLPQEGSSLLNTYRVVAEHIRKNGTESIGSFIVSMTKEVSDLLLVFLFLREAGILLHDELGYLSSPFQVVPLFETIEDLECAPEIFENYISHSIVKLSSKNQPIQIMLGYSDSNKDGGIFASQWSLYQAENSLTKIAEKHNLKIRFFHGRGGTISRGGGKTHKFLDALPHGSLTGNIRMTVQGETIAQQFANKINAAYNLELYLATTTKVTLRHLHMPKKEHQAFDIVKRLAKDTSVVYNHLLKSDGFLDFFSQATPIDAIERSRIGSRPARRTGKRSFEDLRAIPWVFSWNQSRFYLPNWYGVGSALSHLKGTEPKSFQTLQKEVKEWHFLNYLIRNIETGLFSADPKIYSQYASLVTNAELKKTLEEEISKEYEMTREMLGYLRDGSLEKSRPGMIETLQLRNQGLSILHSMQIELLKNWRREPDNEGLLNELLLSVNAIASGLRTTG